MKNSHIESLNRLIHIKDAIETIEGYIENETKESFCQKNILQDAVLFQFTVIGEAIIHVEDEKLEKYDYPWYKVRSFRNLIAHEYFNIKMIAVWEIIQSNLPELKAKIQAVIDNEF